MNYASFSFDSFLFTFQKPVLTGILCKFNKDLTKRCCHNKKHSLFAICLAELAQLVEQRIRNAWVGGSSPPFGST